MRTIVLTHIVFFWFAGSLVAATAVEFTNLGFEEANRNGIDYPTNGIGSGTVEDLLPGWQLSHGGLVLESVGFDAWVLGAGPLASVFDSRASRIFFDFPIDGEYAFKASDPPELLHTHSNRPPQFRLGRKLFRSNTPLFPGRSLWTISG